MTRYVRRLRGLGDLASRTLSLAKSALVTGIAFELFETLRPQPTASGEERGSFLNATDNSTAPSRDAETPSNPTAPVSKARRPPQAPEVARPPVSWWLAASPAERAAMRQELREKLGRTTHPSTHRLFRRMHNYRTRLAEKRALLAELLAIAERPSTNRYAQIQETRLAIYKLEHWLQHARVRARREHEAAVRIKVQRRVLAVLEGTGGAFETLLTHAPGASSKL